jgi:hypothetical protein
MVGLARVSTRSASIARSGADHSVIYYNIGLDVFKQNIVN